jgi:hypothetical protein
MPEAKVTRDQIQTGRVNLENIFGSLLPRLAQVGTGLELNEAKRLWGETNTKLAQAIGIGLRPEALLPLLNELFDFSAGIIYQRNGVPYLKASSNNLILTT